MTSVLLVVRNDKVAQTIASACRDRGSALERKPSLSAALEHFKEAAARESGDDFAVILDLAELATKSDKKINQTIADLPPGLKLVGLGSGFELKSVTSFLRSGLFDYLNLPLDPIELTRSLNKVLGSLSQQAESQAKPSRKPAGAAPKKERLSNDSSRASAGPDESASLSPLQSRLASIVGQDPALLEVFRIVEKVAATDSTVMVHGESGTGKELVARAIHQASPRRDKPMIPVNCGAIPEELLETELFGHERGAFTNAIRDRIGRFEMADGGTIFLDEIGDMSPKLQVKLLRVIQEHEFERVGGDKTISVDIRIITATHVDLSKAVDDGRFREDLYYRLNVIPLTIPPLRERASDVPLLVDYFLAKLRQTRGSKVASLTPDTLALLSAYSWPGNVRELENLMERMVILADGPVLTRKDLPQRLLKETEGKVDQAPCSLAGARPEAPGRTLGPAPRSTPNAGMGDPEAEDSETTLGTAEKPVWPDFSHLGAPDEASPETSTEVSGEASPASAASDLKDDDVAPESTNSFRPTSQDGKIKVEIDESLWAFISPIISFPQSGLDLNAVLSKIEDCLIKAALSANGQVKNQAARALGLNRTTFLEKLKKKDLDNL
jgi:DNA-binding NtrC family response regulator